MVMTGLVSNRDVMTPVERLAMIRARLRQPTGAVPKPTGLHRAQNPTEPRKTIRKPYRRNEAGCRAYDYGVAGESSAVSDNRPPWVYRPDDPKPAALAVKRTAKTHHLTRIAEDFARRRKSGAKPHFLGSLSGVTVSAVGEGES